MSNLMKKRIGRIATKANSFVKDRTGIAMMEFAFALPVLMTLAAGSFELARYALILQKLDRISGTLSDLISRSGSEAMSETEIANIMDSARYMARPFDVSENTVLVLTSVQGRAGQAPYILSQRVDGVVAGVSSYIGDGVNGDVTLPTAFPDAGSGETLSEGETLVVAEVFYSYTPFLTGDLGFFADTIFYEDAYFRPRFTDKIEFPS